MGKGKLGKGLFKKNATLAILVIRKIFCLPLVLYLWSMSSRRVFRVRRQIKHIVKLFCRRYNIVMAYVRYSKINTQNISYLHTHTLAERT